MTELEVKKGKAITLRLKSDLYLWLKEECDLRGMSMNAFLSYTLHQMKTDLESKRDESTSNND